MENFDFQIWYKPKPEEIKGRLEIQNNNQKSITEFNEIIQKTREYLDYLEEHYNNVQKAWKIIQDKCKDMPFIYDDFQF